jgi:two-component system response regulator YesN
MIEVLLVDDESYVTESLKATIPWEDLGVRSVYQAESAREALELLERHQIDILVTDIQMPEMSGLKLIELAQAHWPNIRCMLLTGHSEFHYAKKAIELQVFDYVLKPVDDQEFISSLSNAIESLKDEWAQVEQYYQLVYERKTDLTILRNNLLRELLLGRRMSRQSVEQRLARYEIPLKTDERAVMMLVQLGTYYETMDKDSVTLMEYAISNIAEEVLAESFHVWACQSPHDCLTIIAMLRPELADQVEPGEREQLERQQLKRLVPMFRRSVNEYLRGDISVVVTNGFHFPDAIESAYRQGLRYFCMLEKDPLEKEIYLEEERTLAASSQLFLEALHRPPTLLYLAEAQQWEALDSKLQEVFKLLERSRYTRENLYEVYLTVNNAFMYVAHKQGRSIYQLGSDWILDQNAMQSLDELRKWAEQMLMRMRDELSRQDQHAKHYIVSQVKQLVASMLGQDISVKTIADRVYLHPVYLSKVYKAVTGESLGDYIIRMRMEKALYLLKHTNRRIYEITSELGYQNPQYFSKMFKKYYGQTPAEFRESGG